jgi:hypothetical protein
MLDETRIPLISQKLAIIKDWIMTQNYAKFFFPIQQSNSVLGRSALTDFVLVPPLTSLLTSAYICILQRIRPMWELLKRRNLETRLHNRSERCFLRAEPRFPSLRRAPHYTLLGDAVNAGLHKSIQRRVLPHVRFRLYMRD